MSETIEQQKGAGSSAVARPPGERVPSEMSQEEIAASEKARRYRFRFVDLKTEEPAYHIVHEMPVELMVRHSFVPLERQDDILYVAMADPTNLEVIDEIEAQLHVRLRPAFATQTAIEEALKRGD